MQNLINNENYKKEIDMTISEFIDELLKLQKEGKGEYKMMWVYWSEVGEIVESPIVNDDEKEIYI
jgi:hypothetical protein